MRAGCRAGGSGEDVVQVGIENVDGHTNVGGSSTAVVDNTGSQGQRGNLQDRGRAVLARVSGLGNTDVVGRGCLRSRHRQPSTRKRSRRWIQRSRRVELEANAYLGRTGSNAGDVDGNHVRVRLGTERSVVRVEVVVHRVGVDRVLGPGGAAVIGYEHVGGVEETTVVLLEYQTGGGRAAQVDVVGERGSTT